MGNPLSEVDRAYLAGLLDGDGAIMALIEKHSEKWIVRDQRAVKWLLDMIQPYTRWKQNPVAPAIQILEQPIQSKEDLIRVAKLADTLSKFNVRSRNRRKNHAAMIEESVIP